MEEDGMAGRGWERGEGVSQQVMKAVRRLGGWSRRAPGDKKPRRWRMWRDGEDGWLFRDSELSSPLKKIIKQAVLHVE